MHDLIMLADNLKKIPCQARDDSPIMLISMTHRETIKTTTYRREQFSAVSLRFIFLFLLFTTISFSQNNIEQYDINDPRNPNCPCHKQQQLADEEYALLNKNVDENKLDNKKTIIEIDFKTNTNENSSSNIKQSKHTRYAGSGNTKHKKKNLWYKKTKFRMWNKLKKEIKFKNKVDFCFEW